MIEAIEPQLGPIERELKAYARRQPGARALFHLGEPAARSSSRVIAPGAGWTGVSCPTRPASGSRSRFRFAATPGSAS